MATWPSYLPEPIADAWSEDVNARLKRMSMDAGNYKQRRLSWTQPEGFQFTFAVPFDSFRNWVAWVNNNAYDWFDMPILSAQSTATEICLTREVRFISDPVVTQGNGDFVYITVRAEARGMGINQEISDRGWIIAGKPSDPSTDWIIAGTPSNPSEPDIIIAGTPDSPAIYI